MKLIDVLRNARQLLSNKDNWTKHTLARDRFEQSVGVHDKNASCWCALGAIQKYSQKNQYSNAVDLIVTTNNIKLQPNYLCPKEVAITQINDKKGRNAVLKMFDKTIKFLENQ